MTTIYLIRHSEPLKGIDFSGSKDSLQLINEKNILSINGELKAKELSEIEELQNIDVLFSSNYVRAFATAKYIANKNKLNIITLDSFGERKFGIDSWTELTDNFEHTQFIDEKYKLPAGESQEDTRKRMLEGLMDIIKDNNNKKIVIVSHATAIVFLLKKWCDISFINGNYQIKFNNKIIFDKSFSAPEVFKLEFDMENLISISNI